MKRRVKEKRNIKTKLLAGIIFFLAFCSFFLLETNETLAAEKEPTGYCGVRCFDTIVGDFASDPIGNALVVEEKEGITKTECTQLSEEAQKSVTASSYDKCISIFEAGKTKGDLSRTSSFHPDNNNNTRCNFTESPMVCLLSPFLVFVKIILLGAATFFGWILDTDNIRIVLGGGGVVYKMWFVIRDLLNIAFILVLLFSAFATIFQIEKYHYKKILLTLVIMALLVNFSYPVSRIMIDFSNVLMYSLIKTFLPSEANSLFMTQTILEGSTLKKLFMFQSYEKSGAGTMMVAVVFLFIFSITLMAFAIVLFIRLVALALLVMLSPIGFVGNIIPGFESFAKKWWDNLFKYAFMGPILMLGLYISIQMMNNISGLGNFENIAQKTTSEINSNFLGSVGFLAIPIILLWSTMGIAQSLSTAGANAVMGKAQGFMKKTGKWAGRGFGIPKATGLSGGVKKFGQDFKKTGKAFGKQPLKYAGFGGSDIREAREDKMKGFFSGGKSGWLDAKQNIQNKAIADTIEKNKKENRGQAQLEKDLDSTNEVTKMAASLTLAEKGLLTDIDKLENALKAIGNTNPRSDEFKSQIINKVKKDKLGNIFENGSNLKKSFDQLKSNERDVLQNRLKGENKIKAIVEYEHAYGGKTAEKAIDDNLRGMNAEKLAKQDIHKIINDKSNPLQAKFKDYMEDIATDPNHTKYFTDFFSDLNRDNRNKYIKEGIQ